MKALKQLLEKVEAGDFAEYKLWDDVFQRDMFNALGAINGSLDRAKALHDAVLPGWTITISQRFHGSKNARDIGKWHARLFSVKEAREAMGDCDNPARAWLIAILKALIEKE